MTNEPRLNICFIDAIGWDYGIDTPYSKPLGGSQSALCYLADKLQKAGHDITIINGISSPEVQRGVQFLSISNSISNEILGAFDIIVAVNGGVTISFDEENENSPILVYWMTHDVDQPPAQFLADPQVHDTWDYYVFVSDWQRRRFQERFGLAPAKCQVKRNAISPAFENVTPEEPWFDTGRPPTLIYTSTPYRGLDVLLGSFMAIRQAFPDAVLKVISSMGIYQQNPDEDPFKKLYDICRERDGIEYIGAVSQTELASIVSSASALAYPSTFKETSCISVMESLSMGCLVLSTKLGALEDTAAGYGLLIDYNEDKQAYCNEFAGMVIHVLRDCLQDPEKYRTLRKNQIDYARADLTWNTRAIEWNEWLVQICNEKVS